MLGNKKELHILNGGRGWEDLVALTARVEDAVYTHTVTQASYTWVMLGRARVGSVTYVLTKV